MSINAPPSSYRLYWDGNMGSPLKWKKKEKGEKQGPRDIFYLSQTLPNEKVDNPQVQKDNQGQNKSPI